MKRILVTGSRDWADYPAVVAAIAEAANGDPAAVVVHGGARGADLMADTAARSLKLGVEVHPANWQALGKSAGILRNRFMVDLGADVCLAFIRNGSRGATHCAGLAEARGIPTLRFVQDDAAVAS